MPFTDIKNEKSVDLLQDCETVAAIRNDNLLDSLRADSSKQAGQWLQGYLVHH